MKKILPVIIVISTALVLAFIALFHNNELFDLQKFKYISHHPENFSRKNSVPIILYHNIDGKGPFSISYKKLEHQFQIIKNLNIKVIPLKKLIQQINTDPKPKQKELVITFDDGYNSMYTRLLPLAKKFNYPITLFVYTDFIYRRAKKAMTWEKLREMEKQGIDIECHTMTHKDLTKYSENNKKDSKIIFDEMFTSKKIIEYHLRKKIKYFAFPYGRYNLKILNIAKNLGYKRVFSTDYGSNVLTRDNFCLRRHHIKKDYSDKTFIKIIK